MKKQPQRMCVCCRKMFDKKDLIRIVKCPDGLVHVDLTGKMGGKGQYLCLGDTCETNIQKKKSFSKLFACNPTDEIISAFSKEIKQCKEKRK